VEGGCRGENIAPRRFLTSPLDPDLDYIIAKPRERTRVDVIAVVVGAVSTLSSVQALRA